VAASFPTAGILLGIGPAWQKRERKRRERRGEELSYRGKALMEQKKTR